MSDSNTTVIFYLARAHDGTFARGSVWIRNLENARLYRTIGPAKSAATKRAKEHPEEPIAEILEWKLDINAATVINMEGATKKAVSRISRQKEERLRRYVERRREDLERELARKTEELKRLSR